MCKVLQVSTSSYYSWKQRRNAKQELSAQIDRKIKTEFDKSKANYGSPRVTIELHKQGVNISESTVARKMKALKISPIIKKKFKVTTDSKHKLPIAENLLDRRFEVDQVSKYWVSDITYILVGSVFYYLTTVMDLADRMIIGWNLSDNMTDKHTTIAAFEKAVRNRSIVGQSLMFHSDRGVQYASKDFVAILDQYDCIQSMSRKGNCWDNAVAESFFKTLKTELINKYKFTTPEQLDIALFDYIDGWYNTTRIHTSLNGLSPVQKYRELTNQAA